MRTMSVSQFKSTCLAEFEAIARGGEAITITKRGVPIAQISAPVDMPHARLKLGGMAGRMRILGDIMEPVVPESDWEVLR